MGLLHGLLTDWADKVGEVKVQLLDSDLDVLWLHAEAGVAAVGSLPQTLSVG